MKADVTPVEQDDILFRQDRGFEMFPSHGLLTLMVRIDDGIVGDPVEHIVKNGDPGHRTPFVLGMLGDPEVFLELPSIGEDQRGTIHGEHAQSLVGLKFAPLIEKPAKNIQKPDKDPVGKFFAGLANRASAHDPAGDIHFEDGLKKLIEFILKGALEIVDQKENNQGKGQEAIAGEGFGRETVSVGKRLRVKNLLDPFDERLAKRQFRTCS